VQRREFEYIRHGTRSFVLSRDVVTGKVLVPLCGPTRTEPDFLSHMQALVATEPEVKRWHSVCDQLNIHQSESLVCWVADLSGITEDLGVKSESGILASMTTRAVFLCQNNHKVVFRRHTTPYENALQ
jgi:putative transposase